MKDLLKTALNTVDSERIMKETSLLTSLEFPQTYKAYENAADYVYNLLKKDGFEAEKLTFPADGETVFQDKISPLAWDASKGKITVLSGFGIEKGTVMADYEKMPFSLIKHSVSTPKGGIITKIVTENQVYAGESCQGALVLLEAGTPAQTVLKDILDRGAIGFLSEYIYNPHLASPDDRTWVNGVTETSNWHVIDGDRDFIGFSLSQNEGRKLRIAANHGEVLVKAESDGKRYEGEINAVTALYKGKSDKELWIMAHLYEPLATDNSSGVIASIETLRAIKSLYKNGDIAKPEVSIRVVFAMEYYGFAAVAEHFGGKLHDRCIGAINIDGLPVSKGIDKCNYKIKLSPYRAPFFGNLIMELLAKDYADLYGGMVLSRETWYTCDVALSDPTVGVPTVWPYHDDLKYWHNCAQTMGIIDEELFAKRIAFVLAWVIKVTTINRENAPEVIRKSAEHLKSVLESTKCKSEEEAEFLLEMEAKRLENFRSLADIPEIDTFIEKLKLPAISKEDKKCGKWYKYAEGIIAERLTRGLPYSFANIPRNKRKHAFSTHCLDTPFVFVLAGMDGEKTLARLIDEARWETGAKISEEDIKVYFSVIEYLAKGGYIKVTNKNIITKNDIINELQRVGVKKGDTLLFHSALSECGEIEGGAETVIDALCEVLGEEGTVLMPSFNWPYIGYEGIANKGKVTLPFSKETADNIITGAIPKALLKRKGSQRSAHATHSWVGIGKNAKECLSGHTLLGPPVSSESPLEKALGLSGKVLFFGCDINVNTFLHYIEDKVDAIYLENAVVKIKDDKGRERTHVIERHLPGHRNFYPEPAIENEFYKKALKKGLEISSGKVGTGDINLMNLKELYDIGMELFREDPLATLCENPDCMSCSKYRKMLNLN